VPGTRAHPWVGCSGWSYAGWRGAFYPPGLPTSHWLRHYARHFDTVEVNGTFYRLPAERFVTSWRRQTPDRFLMAVKASRYLTHTRALANPEDPLERLFTNLRLLGPKLGPVLYQLPPAFEIDLARLERFLSALPRRLSGVPTPLRHVVEFRHPSWYVSDTFALLDRHDVTVCLHDKRGSELIGPVTGPIVYVRFHGTTGAYAGGYDDAALEEWAQRLGRECRDGRDVYAYFNNDIDGHAVENARDLRARLDDAIAPATAAAGGHRRSRR
jgi:uncharacterized protein YecE (DUF72 family)